MNEPVTPPSVAETVSLLQIAWNTVTETVATFEVAVPSEARYVNDAGPVYPGAGVAGGVKVTVPSALAITVEPAGLMLPKSPGTSVLPSTSESLASTGISTLLFWFTSAVSSPATGASLTAPTVIPTLALVLAAPSDAA